MHIWNRTLLVFTLLTGFLTAIASGASHPNIVLIYADDLGYGDVSCYGATRVQTPNIDRIAREGIRFTDAHATSSTCTPSRFSLLTGEYAWRYSNTGIAPGDATALIKPGRSTLPGLLKAAGYATAAVGKWHLGLGEGKPDWNGELKPGPLEIGFDYCFIMPATADRVPCVFVENHRVVGLDPKDPISVSFAGPIGNEPTGKEHPELLRLHPSMGHDMTIVNGISRIGYMSGGHSARWVDEDLAKTFVKKSTDFIRKHKDQPFFLYLATHDIHVPRPPNAKFAGKSPMGARGDVILQLDWTVGEILKTLDRLKLSDNTLLIFTSDNGPVVDDGYKDRAVELLGNHRPSGPWRGGKYSNFEAGTRVPMLLRWPGHVKPAVSDAVICQIDFAASFAALAGETLAPKDVPDSTNQLPALLGETNQGRKELVEQGPVLSLRQGNWKYLTPGKGPAMSLHTNIELGNLPTPQLYDLSVDPGETHNVADQHPEIVSRLSSRLAELRRSSLPRPY
ncbi:MAG: sulfatase-like hydrolase/transferase [Opitutaceae bacterium]|nr:sulfatase-like hydrolase/transferase [Opitutaceae bacterium]